MKFMSVHQAPAGIWLLCLLTINAPAVLSAVPQGSLKETAQQEIQRARRDIARGDFREAKKALKRALHLQEDSSEACLLMAGIHRIEGQKDDAFKFVKKAIALNGQNVEAQTFYAQLLFEAGRLEEARKQLTARSYDA
jgi:Tfp pilus assembly protein PilF